MFVLSRTLIEDGKKTEAETKKERDRPIKTQTGIHTHAHAQTRTLRESGGAGTMSHVGQFHTGSFNLSR